MRKNRPQVTSELKDWRDWLVKHVPKTIKDKASRAFKTFKDKVMGLFKGGNERETIEDQTPALRPYQLRSKETFIEPPMEQPPLSQKQVKRMKKKLAKLNKKIMHSKKKNNNLISIQNSIKKKIEELKGLSKPEESFTPVNLEEAFNGAYKSYRINGRSRWM